MRNQESVTGGLRPVNSLWKSSGEPEIKIKRESKRKRKSKSKKEV